MKTILIIFRVLAILCLTIAALLALFAGIAVFLLEEDMVIDLVKTYIIFVGLFMCFGGISMLIPYNEPHIEHWSQ